MPRTTPHEARTGGVGHGVLHFHRPGKVEDPWPQQGPYSGKPWSRSSGPSCPFRFSIGPVPPPVDPLVNVLKIIDMSAPVEQVIDVPKVFLQNRIPQRTVLRGAQMAEQLADVPAVPFFVTFQFRLVVGVPTIFKVSSQGSVQQLVSVEVISSAFTVRQDRSILHPRKRKIQSSAPVVQVEYISPAPAVFPELGGVQVHVCDGFLPGQRSKAFLGADSIMFMTLVDGLTVEVLKIFAQDRAQRFAAEVLKIFLQHHDS